MNIFKIAKRLALDETNELRKKKGWPPLVRVSQLWWKLHKRDVLVHAAKSKSLTLGDFCSECGFKVEFSECATTGGMNDDNTLEVVCYECKDKDNPGNLAPND